ncbi:YcbK family protein [Sulfitobacter sp. 1A13353]|uniref:YcbK family protein n=1 Tax=Sulfitobacter sp. 1A13353 TaxID=3368568 RepID=UPI003745601D
MRLNRRDLLLGAASAGASCSLPSMAFAKTPSRLDSLKPIIKPHLRMWNANTNERISTTFWRDGQYDVQELRRIDWFMRDWREAEIKPCSRNLLWGLAAISEAAVGDGHSGEIRFLSGYRSRATNDMLRRNGGGAARNSLHIKAKAVDFSFPGIPVEPIFKYAKWLQVGGCGHYPGSFVHMDTGDRRTWIGS